MDQPLSRALPRAASRARRLPRNAGFGRAMLVAGLALTVAWLGLVAWGMALLVGAAM